MFYCVPYGSHIVFLINGPYIFTSTSLCVWKIPCFYILSEILIEDSILGYVLMELGGVSKPYKLQGCVLSGAWEICHSLQLGQVFNVTPKTDMMVFL